MLNDLRTKYIPSTYRTRPSMYKLMKLFTCTNENTVGNLSIFINKAFVIRNNDLLKIVFVFLLLLNELYAA